MKQDDTEKVTTENVASENGTTERSEQLKALRHAAMVLTSQLNLSAVLQTVVDESRKLVGAKYAALGVLNDTGDAIEYFITSGISAEQRAHIGALPRGKGLLGAIITEGKPLRVDNIGEDPRSVGFHKQHPVMHSMLGVPIIARGRAYGNLYLTDKIDSNGNAAGSFTAIDEETIELFAMEAAIAIENARLHRHSEQLAIAQERERFSMDLHDGIIQSIYAVGLTLDDARYNLDHDRVLVRQRLDRAIAELDEVIRDIRSYILKLSPSRLKDRTLQSGLEEMTRDVRAYSFIDVRLDLDAEASDAATPEQTSELLHVAKEALANIRKHAQAKEIRLSLHRAEDMLVLKIADDGIGFASDRAPSLGYGLINMQKRIARLNGTVEIESALGAGTKLTAHVPVRNDGT